VREKDGIAKNYTLSRNYEIEISFSIAPESYTWFTME
jgi:hypothetical protein